MLIINIIIVASNIATTSSTKEVYKPGNGYTELEKQIIALQEPLQIQRQQEITALKNKIEQELKYYTTLLQKIIQNIETEICTLMSQGTITQDTKDIRILQQVIPIVKEKITALISTTQLTIKQIKNIISDTLIIIEVPLQDIEKFHTINYK